MARRSRDPLWYKDAIIYEVHVRAFQDSVGDGNGDFPGLTSRLDYLQDLGVTALWLLPFYPSPLKDDGYDTADYTDVHPAYGTMRDFRALSEERQQELESGRLVIWHYLRNLIARGCKEGYFRSDVDVVVATTAILGAINYLPTWYESGRPPRVDRMARGYAEFLVEGLLVAPSGNSSRA